MAPNPVLRDVYIAVSCSGRPATTRAPPLVSAGSFLRTNEQHGEGWIADNGKLADPECGRRRKVLPDFFLDVLRLSSIGSRAVFLSRYYLATGASNFPRAVAACAIVPRICGCHADLRAV